MHVLKRPATVFLMSKDLRPHIWLKNLYEKRKQKNPRFSLRAFAKLLDIPSGRLSEYLSNKRLITVEIANQMAQRLKLSPEEEAEFIQRVKEQLELRDQLAKAERELQRPPEFEFLSKEKFKIISEWYHYAILSLLEVKGFKTDIRWIAEQLGIGEELAQAGVERLTNLKIIEKSENGWKLNVDNLRTTDDVPSEALQSYHKQILERNILALQTVPVEDRDISNISLAIDKSKLPFAKNMIKNFRRRMMKLLEAGEQTEVYNLSIQLVPVNRKSTSDSSP